MKFDELLGCTIKAVLRDVNYPDDLSAWHVVRSFTDTELRELMRRLTADDIRGFLVDKVDACLPTARAQIYHEDMPKEHPDNVAARDAAVPNGREL